MEMQTTIVVDSLASHGAGLNAKDETGVTPLMSAARSEFRIIIATNNTN